MNAMFASIITLIVLARVAVSQPTKNSTPSLLDTQCTAFNTSVQNLCGVVDEIATLTVGDRNALTGSLRTFGNCTVQLMTALDRNQTTTGDLRDVAVAAASMTNVVMTVANRMPSDSYDEQINNDYVLYVISAMLSATNASLSRLLYDADAKCQRMALLFRLTAERFDDCIDDNVSLAEIATDLKVVLEDFRTNVCGLVTWIGAVDPSCA